MLRVSALLIALLSLAADAFAHGGRTTPAPPLSNGAAPNASGAVAPAGPPARTPAGVTPRRRATSRTTDVGWQAWWDHNRDAYLRFRAPVHRDPATPSANAQAPADGWLEQRVVPALIRALGDEHHEVRGAAAIALGKTGVDAVAGPIAVRLADPHSEVRQSAALALGLLGAEGAPERLATVCAGRQRTPRFTLRARAFAALGLGLRASPAAIDRLRDVLERREAAHDVPACALLALGELGDERGVRALARAIDARRLPDEVRAFAAIALGKSAAPDAVDALLPALVDRSADVRASAAIALGAFGPRPSPDARERRLIAERIAAAGGSMRPRARERLDRRAAELDARIDAWVAAETERTRRVLTALRSVASGRRSRGTLPARNFAAISIGRIGGDAAVRALIDVADRAKPVELRAFATLGLALAARTATDERERAAHWIGRAFTRARTADLRGASAIALGLLGRPEAREPLLAALRDAEDHTVRGHLALATGMVGCREAIEPLRRILRLETNVLLRRNAALALGLLDDRTGTETLVAVLRRSGGRLVHGSAALALGRTGDRRAIDPLIELLHAERAPSQSRAFAAVALGLLAEDAPVPRLARFSAANNYLIPVAAVRDAMDIL